MELNISNEIDSSVKSDIMEVYNKIKNKFPDDALRLSQRISEIIPLEKSYENIDICGRWGEDIIDRNNDVISGILELRSSELLGISKFEFLGIIAHEFGHAVSRHNEIEDRTRYGYLLEWASEATADYYAYKWGFKESIILLLQNRKLSHHGILPGMEVTIGDEEDYITYTLDDDFYPVIVNASELEPFELDDDLKKEGWC
jgi:hypothetical protein